LATKTIGGMPYCLLDIFAFFYVSRLNAKTRGSKLVNCFYYLCVA